MESDRRTIIKAAVWGVPTVSVARQAPAFAASTSKNAATGRVSSVQAYTIIKSVKPFSGKSGGYIDTRSTGPNGDGRLDPATSTGFWLEGVVGSASFTSASITYTFTNAVTVEQNPGGYSRVSGKEQWSTATALNGWTVSTTSTTIALTWSKPYAVTVSGTAAGSGTALPGVFLNYAFVSAAAGTGRVQTTYKAEYVDATGAHTWSRSTNGQVI